MQVEKSHNMDRCERVCERTPQSFNSVISLLVFGEAAGRHIASQSLVRGCPAHVMECQAQLSKEHPNTHTHTYTRQREGVSERESVRG